MRRARRLPGRTAPAQIGRAVEEAGVIDREELARRVGAGRWGPGRFNNALREALAEGRVRRVTRNTYGPRGPRAADGAQPMPVRCAAISRPDAIAAAPVSNAR